MKKLINIFLICIGMLSAFAITDITPIPLIVSMLALIFIVIKVFRGNLKVLFFKEDILVLLIIVNSWISLALSNVNSKVFNHTTAFTIVILLYYFTIRILIINTRESLLDISKYLFIGIMISSVYALFEFISKNYILSLAYINDLIYRPSVMMYSPIYNGRFIRVRSFTEESGVFALYLNVCLPIALIYIYKRYSGIKKGIVLGIILSAYILTFSAGGIGFLLISIIIAGLIYICDNINRKRLKIKITYKRIYIFIVALICILVGVYLINDSIIEYINPILNKITLKNDSGRFERWNNTLYYFKQQESLKQMLGIGIGKISDIFGRGTTSLYIDLLVQNGVISLIMFVVYIFIIIYKIFNINDKYKYLYLISIISVLLHYCIISNFWFPFLWFIITMIQLHQYIIVYEGVEDGNINNNC